MWTAAHTRALDSSPPEDAFAARLASLGDVTAAQQSQVGRAWRDIRPVAARITVACDPAPQSGHRVLRQGWAARSRILGDGRRQLLELILPGDAIDSLAPANGRQQTVVALTPLRIGTLDPAIFDDPAVAAARRRMRALAWAYAYNQITRLGRQTAYERIAHLLLELRERLDAAGLADGDSFPMPLTQECLSDVLGLTPVHVNRTVQQLRRDGMIAAPRNEITLIERQQLAALADYAPSLH